MLLVAVLNSTCGKSKLYHICFLSNVSVIMLYSVFPVFFQCASIHCIRLSFHLQCFCNVDSLWNKGFHFLHKLFYCLLHNWIHCRNCGCGIFKVKQSLYFHHKSLWNSWNVVLACNIIFISFYQLEHSIRSMPKCFELT